MRFNIRKLDCHIGDYETSQLICIDDMSDFVGTVSLQFKGKKSANICQLYVDPKFRRKGLGRALVNKCCRLAVDEGCETLGLLLTKGNSEAQIFYEKLGFIFTYQYENDDILMSIVL